MGYISVIEGDITFVKTGKDTAPIEVGTPAPSAKFLEEARRLNIDIPTPTPKSAEITRSDLPEGIRWHVSNVHDHGGMCLVEFNGDSGKAYYFERDLEELIDYMGTRGYTVEPAELIRVGEDAPDVEKFIINENGSIESMKGKLVFPDGTEYLG